MKFQIFPASPSAKCIPDVGQPWKFKNTLHVYFRVSDEVAEVINDPQSGATTHFYSVDPATGRVFPIPVGTPIDLLEGMGCDGRVQFQVVSQR